MGVIYFREKGQKEKVPFSSHHPLIRVDAISVIITADNDLGHPAEMCVSGFSTVRLLFLPLSILSSLEGSYIHILFVPSLQVTKVTV